MATTGGIQLIDAFRYSGKRFLDLRQHSGTLAELTATPETSIPDGFNKFCDETQCWYEYNSHNDIDPETGRWRKSVPIHEMISEEYIFAIIDADGTFLFGIREDGTVVYNKGMSDEVRVRFAELEGYQPMSNENFIYAIVDAGGRVLFGITRSGEVVYDKGIPEEVKPILRRINRLLTDTRERMEKAEAAITSIKERLAELDGYRLMEDENFIFAIMDKDEDYLLFGIDRTGRVVFDKGIPGEVQTRFDELKGYQVMHDENYLFAITDNIGTLLFGIETSGHAVVPRGIVEYVSREEYTAMEPHKDTLYIVKGRNGGTEGAYINGEVLNTGEECCFYRDANMIKYDGGMKSTPIIHIDHEDMTAKIDYPSDYSGPMIVSDRETKTLFVI
ncbi:hypothetical protein [uncultured Duncaniella sp.]|uniref:hypothetical protein n=1 Tax=uncultured Duncaniella sp. TaxID=2768039 RepID=UPI0026F4069E|nr:hypothetical protein [uncultured Duncaniella sp.]